MVRKLLRFRMTLFARLKGHGARLGVRLRIQFCGRRTQIAIACARWARSFFTRRAFSTVMRQQSDAKGPRISSSLEITTSRREHAHAKRA
jgi:hypothetical protein